MIFALISSGKTDAKAKTAELTIASNIIAVAARGLVTLFLRMTDAFLGRIALESQFDTDQEVLQPEVNFAFRNPGMRNVLSNTGFSVEPAVERQTRPRLWSGGRRHDGPRPDD